MMFFSLVYAAAEAGCTVTFTLAEAALYLLVPFALTVITAFPEPLAVIFPLASTVATAVLEEVKVLEVFELTVSVFVLPGVMVRDTGLTLTVWFALLTTTLTFF